jgi:hypothetical protein
MPALHREQIDMRVLVSIVTAALLGASGVVVAQETVRHGIQIGALGALRTTLPEAGAKQV